MENPVASSKLWEYTKAIILAGFSGVIIIKIYKTPINLTVDFPTLISLLLALFSVGLSAMFYFKATDSSNTFYDNTYKFTKDIAELLIKIESGFGEKLKHLDEGYTSMRSRIETIYSRPADDIEKTKQKIEIEKQEIEKMLIERNKIVQHLLERSQLQKEEKDKITEQLKSKEAEVAQSQAEITKLNRRLSVERFFNKTRTTTESSFSTSLAKYTFEHVIKKIGHEKVLDMPSAIVRRAFDELKTSLHPGYLKDMEHREFFDGRLTNEGLQYLRSVAKHYPNQGV